MKLDWKFIVGLLIAIAGVLAPIWLWQLDRRAHSLKLRLVSSVSLSVEKKIAIPELKISLDGKEIENPVLSVVELLNNGSKPIASADFESPIELKVDSGVLVIKARVTEVSPEDLHVTLDTTSSAIKISPMLLNPGDKISLSVLTAGPDGVQFSPQSRIAGISKISYQNQTERRPRWIAGAFFTSLGVIGIALYFLATSAVIWPNTFLVSRPLAALTTGVAVFSGIEFLTQGLQFWLIEPRFYLMGGIVTVIAIFMYPFHRLTRQRAKSGSA